MVGGVLRTAALAALVACSLALTIVVPRGQKTINGEAAKRFRYDNFGDEYTSVIEKNAECTNAKYCKYKDVADKVPAMFRTCMLDNFEAKFWGITNLQIGDKSSGYFRFNSPETDNADFESYYDSSVYVDIFKHYGHTNSLECATAAETQSISTNNNTIAFRQEYSWFTTWCCLTKYAYSKNKRETCTTSYYDGVLVKHP